MQNKRMKLENPERLREFDIRNTLEKAIRTTNDVVCDYGAGTGVFTIEAAKMTQNKVLAMDMNSEMIDIIKEKVAEESLKNVEVIKVKEDSIEALENNVDVFLLVTVLHEINDVPSFVIEVKRVLKEGGRIVVVDFYKRETPMGPPVNHRMSAYQAARHFLREGIVLEEQYELGDNFYLLLLKK